MRYFRIVMVLIASSAGFDALGQSSVQKDTLALKVIGTWNLEKFTVNGNEDLNDRPTVNDYIVFNYDQTYLLSEHIKDSVEKGTWGIDIGHEKITMVDNMNTTITNFKIISIKENSLVLQPLIGMTDEYVLYFRKKK